MRLAMISRLIPDRFVLLLFAAVLLGWLLPVALTLLLAAAFDRLRGTPQLQVE